MSSFNESGLEQVDEDDLEQEFDYSDFKVVSAVTAVLNSKQYSYEVGDLWPQSKDVCKKFVNAVEVKFKRKNKFHSYYGQELKDSKSSVPNRLLSYLGGEGFKDFVTNIVSSIADEAAVANASSNASNIVFVHYSSQEEGDLGRLLVVMLDKKNGFDFDQNLVPKDAAHINLDSLKQAAYVDLTLFKELFPSAPLNETYLKFIQGSSRADFFKKALGCEVKADNGKSIRQLREALESFQVDKGLSDKFFEKVQGKFEASYKKALSTSGESSISLDYLASLVDSELPVNSKLQGKFLIYVNRNYEVNEYIEPTHHAVREDQWINVKASDETYSVKVFRKKIGKPGSGNSIEFNSETNKLTFFIDDQSARISLRRLVGLDDE